MHRDYLQCGPLLHMADMSPTYCTILFYFDFTTAISEILVQHGGFSCILHARHHERGSS